MRTLQKTQLLILTLPLLATSSAAGQTARITPILVPGATALAVSGLNQAGQVAGDYYAGTPNARAFLWDGGTAQDLGTLGGTSSSVFGLNNLGDVVGHSTVAGDTAIHAYLFTEGFLVDLGGLGGSFSSASMVNDFQQVAGYSYTSPAGIEIRPFLVRTLGGEMMDIGTLGGSSGSPAAINLGGQVAGTGSTAGDAATHAWLYTGGNLLDLGTLGGDYSFSMGMNLYGRVTGGATTADGALHAFLNDGFGPMLDLGTLGGNFSMGVAVNDAGDIAGDATTAGDAENHAFLHTGGVMTDLGSLGGGYSTTYGLNDLGQVVGVSHNAAGVERAFVWNNGAMIDLNTLLPAGSGWVLSQAYYINNAGQIVGTGTLQGHDAWFLLSPGTGENQPPLANAGPDQAFECATNAVLVSLDASASSDPDGDALAFEWSEDGNVLGTTAQLQVSLAPGSHTLNVRVTDARGAEANDTLTVTVGDTQAPAFNCPAGRTAEANANGRARLPNFLRGLIVTDNCTRPGALHRSQSPAAGTALGCGTHLVTLTVADAAGNATSCVVSFVVVDVTAPTVHCPAELTRRAGANGLVAVPDHRDRVSDNCTPDNELIVVQTPAPGTLVGLGQYAITVTATDAAGNGASCTSQLNVVDRTDPTIHALTASPDSLVAGSGAMVPVTLTVVATDNCDPGPVSRIVSVTSSEAVTGGADTTAPDWNITADLTLELRAERSAPNNSRVYAVKVCCTDASGNASMRTVHIAVKKAARY